jgi:hypothetical protein
VQKLGQAGEYQIARKLYFNSLAGFPTVATGLPSGDKDEYLLAKFEASGQTVISGTSSDINSVLIAQKEFTLGAEFAGSGSGPDPQFCEDFNEQMVCNDSAGAPANVNGCLANAGVAGIPGGAAGVTGSNTGALGANQVAGTSTICGDGIRQAYEECDNGTVLNAPASHPLGNSSKDTTPGACSTTCRCIFDFNETSGQCN